MLFFSMMLLNNAIFAKVKNLPRLNTGYAMQVRHYEINYTVICHEHQGKATRRGRAGS